MRRPNERPTATVSELSPRFRPDYVVAQNSPWLLARGSSRAWAFEAQALELGPLGGAPRTDGS